MMLLKHWKQNNVTDRHIKYLTTCQIIKYLLTKTIYLTIREKSRPCECAKTNRQGRKKKKGKFRNLKNNGSSQSFFTQKPNRKKKKENNMSIVLMFKVSPKSWINLKTMGSKPSFIHVWLKARQDFFFLYIHIYFCT